MSKNKNQVSQLLELARSKEKENRQILLENITDLFVSPEGRLSDHERSLMVDILGKLVHEVEMEVRRDLSDRLANLDQAPHELIVALANDEIEVARPILQQSGVLQDPDLIEIVKHRTQEHRVSIALREGLSEEVTEALVDYGDEDVVEALIRNTDAVLSRNAMAYLVSESKRVDRFQEPLLSRPDLPPMLANHMFWWVSAALRQHILKHYTIDEAVLDSFVEDSTKTIIDSSASNKSSAAENLVKRLAELGELNDRFLVQCLRQGRIVVFVAGLAKLCDIDAKLARRIAFERGGEGLAVACKAIGIERPAFASIFLLTRPASDDSRTRDPGVLSNTLRLYDSMDDKQATATLRYWQREPGYVAAVRRIAPGGDG
jgi:uncharacterized protein (DUF2336 family)